MRLRRTVMDSQERFEQLKRKYAPVVEFLDQSHARIQAMDVQNDKLMIRAAVASPELRDKVLEELERIDSSFSDVIPDIRIEAHPNFPSTGQSTVNTAESFSKGSPRPQD